jgi:hypothetical protein
MSRSARSGKSLIGRHAADMEIVGYADFAGIMEGMADAFVEAIRTGVPTRMLPGHQMFGHRVGLSSVDLWNEKMGALTSDLSQATREAKAAMSMAVQGLAEGDEDMHLEYKKLASRRTADAARLRRAIEELGKEQTVLERSEPFDVRADVWVPALHRLRTCGGRFTQAERIHFQTVFPKFKMELVGATWWAVASLRLNTKEGVAELGPVRWPVNAQGRSTVLALKRKAPATGERRTRLEIVAVLIASGRICRDAAQSVSNAPFRELRHLLLHELCGEPLPDWVGPQWRDPVFVDWIVRVYTDPKWVWSNKGKYSSSLLKRQYAVCLVDKHGPMRPSEIIERMGVGQLSVWEFYQPFKGKNTRQRSVQPSLMVLSWPASNRPLLGPVVCECGRNATTVARAPEVLTDLLCPCGLAPGGEALGMPAGLRFPDEYQQMRMTLEQCVELLASRLARHGSMTERERDVLVRGSELLAGGVTAYQVGKAIGLRTINPTLRTLERRGLVEQVVAPGRTYKPWRLTAQGKTTVAELADQ